MIDYNEKMEKIYHERVGEQSDIPLSERVKKQIEDYETFIKYLNAYINEINIRLRRLHSQYERYVIWEQRANKKKN